MMSDSNPTYTAADLDKIFGPGAAEHAAKLVKDAQATVGDVRATVGDAVAVGKDVIAAAKVFYHLYVCRFAACVAAANPKPGSLHQRGLHLASSIPRTDVKCPGCGEAMVIGRNGLNKDGTPDRAGHITEDADGNAVFHGQPILYEAPGQPDQSAELEKENAQ
jgi:hypothetical protein